MPHEPFTAPPMTDEQTAPATTNTKGDLAQLMKWVGGILAATVLFVLYASASSGTGLPASQADAHSYALGVWSGNQMMDETRRLWTKYEFHPDGTFKEYIAEASEPDWPSAPLLSGEWSISEGKYTDTGAHYFAVDLQWRNDEGRLITARFPIIEGGLRATAGWTPFSRETLTVLTRGDHFPR